MCAAGSDLLAQPDPTRSARQMRSSVTVTGSPQLWWKQTVNHVEASGGSLTGVWGAGATFESLVRQVVHSQESVAKLQI